MPAPRSLRNRLREDLLEQVVTLVQPFFQSSFVSDSGISSLYDVRQPLTVLVCTMSSLSFGAASGSGSSSLSCGVNEFPSFEHGGAVGPQDNLRNFFMSAPQASIIRHKSAAENVAVCSSTRVTMVWKRPAAGIMPPQKKAVAVQMPRRALANQILLTSQRARGSVPAASTG